MNFESLSLRILGALFNGGYQGLLLTAIVWLGLRLWPHTNAATRHAAGLATLLVVAALPVVHFLAAGAGDAGNRGEGHPAPPPAVSWKEHRPQAGIETSGASMVGDKEASAVLRTSIPRAPGLAREPNLREVVLPLRRAAAESAPNSSTVTGEPEAASKRSVAEWQAFVPARVALGLAGLWAIFASLRLAKLTGECRDLKALKRRGAAPPERLGMAFDSLRREMRVGRRANLLLVPAPAPPMAVGFLNPAVLLPSGVFRGSTWGALDQILRHELAHLRRWDDWANLVQQLVRCFLFFHPAVWWLSRHLTLDREIACDDHVLAAVPAPRAYALFLTEFAGRDHYRNCSAAPAGWSRKSQLQQRITMILDPNRNASTALAKTRAGAMIAAAALLAALSLHAAPRLELSRTAEPDAEDTTATSNTTVAASTTAGSRAEVVIARDGLGLAGSISSVEPKVKTTIGVHVDAHPKPVPAPAPVAVGPADVLPVRPIPARVPHPMAHPAPARVPLPDVAPVGPRPPVGPVVLASAGAHPKRVADSSVDRDESVEQRLDRLERMIESLLEGKNDPGKPGKDWKIKPDPMNDFGLDMKWDFKWDAKDWEMLGPDKIEQITRQAQQQAAQAAQHAQRMAQEARRGARESYNRALRDVDSHEHQRRILESQRHAMEIQLGNLEAQIAQLEAARDQMEAQMEAQEHLFEQLEEQLEDVEHEDHDHAEDVDDDTSRDRKPPRPAAESSDDRP
jgi:beta-lactamase regulating signal transducer with metallopeptidase domain